MDNEQQYRYFAFISYRGTDVEIAKKLQKRFNNFKLPSTYVNPFDADNQRMQPVCRDRDNFVGGDVSAQINDAIDHSMYVVMVCTPNMTKHGDQENYVNDEIRHLIETNRIERLIPLVFDGRAYTPNDYRNAARDIREPFPDECLPFALREWMWQHNDHDFTLNIFNIEEQGERDEDKMFLRCVATILAEEFTKLWDRFKIEQRRRKRTIAISAVTAICLFVAAIIATISITQPIDVRVSVNEVSVHNDNLPPLKDAIVSITIDNETKKDTIESLDAEALFANIPRKAIGKQARLQVACDNWLSIDTTLMLTERVSLGIARDPHPFGDIYFRLWHPSREQTFPGVKVKINGHETTADSEGVITYAMPLCEQCTTYLVSAPFPLADSTLTMPTTESTVVPVEDN